MYTVVNFNLPDGLTVTLKDYANFSFFNESATGSPTVAPNKVISIEVPDSGGQQITLMKYVVGERIAFRKSLTGLKLIRGLPDYTGTVTFVDLVEHIPTMVQKIKYKYQERQTASSRMIQASNLCKEIPMPTSWDSAVDWASIASARTDETDTIGRLMAQQMTDMTSREGFTRQFLDGGTITGRVTGQTVDAARQARMMEMMTATTSLGIRSLYYQRAGNVGRSQRIEEMSRRYPDNFWADFDGDAIMTQSMLSSRHHEALRMPAVEDQPAPRYSNNPFEDIQLVDVVRATAEVVQGERGRPPASRGPRPRNQRW